VSPSTITPHAFPHCFRPVRAEADDGEAGSGEDAPGDEEDDPRDRLHQQGHHLLPRLHHHDGRTQKLRPQTVRVFHYTNLLFKFIPCIFGIFLYLMKYFSINLYTSHLCAPISF